jgi:hypothetical protein
MTNGEAIQNNVAAIALRLGRRAKHSRVIFSEKCQFHLPLDVGDFKIRQSLNWIVEGWDKCSLHHLFQRVRVHQRSGA